MNRYGPLDQRSRSSGFSLVEMLVVAAMLAVLASIAVPVYDLVVQRQREAELRLALRQIRGALDAYKHAWDSGRLVRTVGESGYPPSLEVLVDGVEDVSDPLRRRIYFLRKLPVDPFAEDHGLDSIGWALRSYESPPDSPAPGPDVFDVHSRSPRVGLNGVAYARW